MIIKEIRKFANEKGIVLPKIATKEVLIHTIQVAEGNNSCYATKKNCYDNSCLWYEDCRKTFKNKKSHE